MAAPSLICWEKIKKEYKRKREYRRIVLVPTFSGRVWHGTVKMFRTLLRARLQTDKGVFRRAAGVRQLGTLTGLAVKVERHWMNRRTTRSLHRHQTIIYATYIVYKYDTTSSLKVLPWMSSTLRIVCRTLRTRPSTWYPSVSQRVCRLLVIKLILPQTLHYSNCIMGSVFAH